MAKGQVRSIKEKRKEKSADKKDKTPRYMRAAAAPIGKATAVTEKKT
jgi:hypothetical protein